jgi:hypothetical protein
LKIYLAGKMAGVPYFNYPAFNAYATKLRVEGHIVFSPPENDIAVWGDTSINNPTGDEQLAAQRHGFSRRRALATDTQWICKQADAIALIPGWETSLGANAELALAKALHLRIIYLEQMR